MGNFLSDAWDGIGSFGEDVGSYIKNTLAPKTPASPAQSIDAQDARDFANDLRAKMNSGALGAGAAPPGAAGRMPGGNGGPGGRALLPGETLVSPTQLDQTAANEARGAQMQNIQDLQGVASGKTNTAADALLTKGTDEAATRARGLAAAYSRANPGAALRSGLAASNMAQAQAAATAAQQKAEEQAQARGTLAGAAQGVRSGDLSAASADQQAAMDAQKANQNAALQGQSLANAYQLGLGNLAAQETNAPIQAQIANQQAAVQTNAQRQQGLGAIGNFAGGVLSSIFSDKRVKTNVKRKSFADAMGDKVHGVEYRYVPDIEKGTPKRAGAIAQELEKVFPGVVQKNGKGVRMVDTGHLSLATAGVVAELARRTKALEARK